MLRDLTIKNYRAFKDFSIDGLARVNLIVGDNNSGKTSFLEAVYLLVNQRNPFSLLELLYDRGEYVAAQEQPGGFEYQMAHVFHGHKPRPTNGQSETDATIQVLSCQEQALSLHIHMAPIQELVLRDTGTVFRLVFTYNGTELSSPELPQIIGLPVSMAYSFQSNFTPSAKQPGPHQLVTTSNVSFVYLAKLWDGIIQAPEKELPVIESLKIIDPTVDDFRFTSHQTPNGVLLKIRGRRTRLPLSSMGDGMRRILTLIMSAVTAENGVLLVDEIDTGLYHGAQANMWRLLIETAQRLNVQVFATTHSWDCVAALQEAVAEANESAVRLFRLEEWKGDIRAVLYDAEDLAVVVRQGIEVR